MPSSDTPLIKSLTARERDFLRLLAEDCSNAEIGDRLVLSTGTVRWYVKQVYAKLGVHSREEAVERANAVLQAPTPPPHNLPTPPTPFVGRERELAELAHIASDHDVRLVTILSPGGMGKTRLAIELAERQLTTFPDGVFFVPLQALSAPDHLLTAIADAVNYRFEESSRSPLQQLGGFLRSKALLLVLDNVEHLLDAAPLVSELLAAAPSVKCLVTSRERLNLRGETVYALDGLDYPTEDAADLTANAAFALFMHSAQYARPGFSPDERDAAAIADICRLVDGMPLALELAARWMDMLSPAEIAAEIRRDLDFLCSEGRDVPARQHSMRVIFGAAWNRMNEAERDAFTRFAMFRGGCTRDAAQAVTGASLRTLAGLVDKGLLRLGSSGRYRVHELLRQFAEEQLNAAGTTDAARAAHSAYYVDLLRRLEPDIKGARFFEAQAELAGDLENLRAACLWAAAQADLEPLAGGIMTLGVFFYTWDGRWLVGATFLGELAAALRRSPLAPVRDGLLAETLAWHGLVVLLLGQTQTAEALLSECASLAARSDAIGASVSVDFALAVFRLDIALAPTITGKVLRVAVQHLERALTLLECHHDTYLRAEVLRRLGRAYMAGEGNNDLDLARRYLEQALHTAQQTGNPHTIAGVLMVRAAAIGFADYTEGKRAFRECAAYCRRTTQRLRLATTLQNLGLFYADYGTPREQGRAMTCYRVALAIYDELDYAYGKALPLGNMSLYLRSQGEFKAARERSRERLSLLETSEDHARIVSSLEALAWIDFLDGQYADAEAWISRALHVVRKEPYTRLDIAAEVLFTAAAIALRQERLDDAAAHLQEGIIAAWTLEQPWRVPRTLLLQGALAYARADIPGARVALCHAIDSSSTVNIPPMRDSYLQLILAWARDLLSQIEREIGNMAASRALVAEVLRVGQQLLSDCLLLMGLLQVAHHVAPLRAVELVSLVQAHRHTYGFSREQAAQLLERLKGEQPAEAFTSAIERGKALDVAQTVEEALEWLEQVEK